MRNSILLACLAGAAFLAAQSPAPSTGEGAPTPKKKGGFKRPPRPGIKEPGVQSPMTDLKPDTVYAVEGVPDWQVVTDDAVWVSNKPKHTLHRMDVASGKVTATIEVGKQPCSGLAAGFGSVWVPLCGDKALARVSIKDNKLEATIPVGPADSEGGIAASKDAVWLPSDKVAGVLSRINPKTNKVVAEVKVPKGSIAAVFGDNAIWVTSNDESVLTRVDAKKNKVTDTIPVGPNPRFLTYGAGSVWTLNQGDGTISRVDTKTRKVVATIPAGIPGGGGEIAFGEGHVWVTVFQIPITKIDAATNKVVRQWVGAGGDAIRYGHGSIWLSNLREQNVWRLPPPK
jgi:virginiamycin B lyase